MITTVAFDADDTLVDTRSAVRSAIDALVAWLGEPSIDAEVVRADAKHYWAIWPERPAHDIRTAAIRETLARVRREGELEDAVQLFFDTRFANSRPFPGVTEVLTELKQEYQLGYGTNANSDADRCGLSGFFAFELYALRTGVPKKPHSDFYVALADAAMADPAEIVYVGDDYHNDVVGPKAAGMRGVWLNPLNLEVPGETPPDAVIGNLVELPRILAGWR